MEKAIVIVLAIEAIAFLLTLLAYGVWAMVCNERTYAARGRLIKLRYSKGIDSPLHGYLDQVSYDEHFRCLRRFGDPRNLYHPSLWGAL